METHRRIVVLNGPSSAGKSSIANAARDLVGARCCVISIDQFYRLVHPDTDNDWSLFFALTQATFATAAAFADSGFSVVVDTVFERIDCLDVCRTRLGAHDVHLVGVHCALPILQEREKQRGNRPLGLAARQHTEVHQDCDYALTLDTSARTIEDCAVCVAALLDGTT